MTCCSSRPGRDRRACEFAYSPPSSIHSRQTDRDRHRANPCPCNTAVIRWLWPDGRGTNGAIPSKWRRVAHVDTRTCSVRSVRVVAKYRNSDALPSRPRSYQARRLHSSSARSSRHAGHTSSLWSIWRRASSRCGADGSNSNVSADAGTRRDAKRKEILVIVACSTFFTLSFAHLEVQIAYQVTAK